MCIQICYLEFFTREDLTRNKNEVFEFWFSLVIHLKTFNKGDNSTRSKNKQFYIPWLLLFHVTLLFWYREEKFTLTECFWMHFWHPWFSFPAFFAFSLLKFQVLWHLPPRSPPLLLLLRLMARSVLILNLSCMPSCLVQHNHLETTHCTLNINVGCRAKVRPF